MLDFLLARAHRACWCVVYAYLLVGVPFCTLYGCVYVHNLFGKAIRWGHA